MEKQEKKIEELSYAERLAKALESLKGTPLPMDTGPFLGDLPKKMPDRFKILCKHPLHQEQQAEARQAQDADEESVEPV